LLRAGAPIDAFGVGAATVAGGDAPTLDASYKLAEYHGVARLKTSPGKATLTRPQAGLSRPQRERRFHRRPDRSSRRGRDYRATSSSPRPPKSRRSSPPDGRRRSRRAASDAGRSRDRLLQAFARLGQRYKDLERPDVYPVRHTAALNAMLTGEKIRSEKRQS